MERLWNCPYCGRQSPDVDKAHVEQHPEYQSYVGDPVRVACEADGHRPLDLNYIGYGGGQLDYFCRGCEKRLKSVKLADMTDIEKTRVGIMVGTAIGR